MDTDFKYISKMNQNLICVCVCVRERMKIAAAKTGKQKKQKRIFLRLLWSKDVVKLNSAVHELPQHLHTHTHTACCNRPPVTPLILSYASE